MYLIYCILQEILQESQIALLQLYCKQIQNESFLKMKLDDMLNLYPNNFFALSVFACIEVSIIMSKKKLNFFIILFINHNMKNYNIYLTE